MELTVSRSVPDQSMYLLFISEYLVKNPPNPLEKGEFAHVKLQPFIPLAIVAKIQQEGILKVQSAF